LAVVTSVARAGKDLISEMTKPIPTPPAGPTAAELRARRPALLEQVETTKTAIAEARAEYEKSFATFAATESEAAGQALWLAEQRIKTRERKLQEFQQQLEAHDEATKVAERLEFEQRDRDIDAELADNRRMLELDAAATRAAAGLVDALLKVRAHNVHRERLRGEQQDIRERLGMGREPPAFRSVEASLVSITDGLRELAQTERDPVRRGYLVSLSMGRIDFLPT
jgi:hypothetical protein